MEIILKEDVLKLGQKGDVVKVADGYARNYLLPRHLAILATPGNLKNVQQMRAAARRKEAQDTASAQALAEQLGKVSLRFTRRAGEHDTLFGSVTTMDIAAELDSLGFPIDRRKIELKDALKSLGQFQVPVHVYRNVTAQLSVSVEREGEAPPAGA